MIGQNLALSHLRGECPFWVDCGRSAKLDSVARSALPERARFCWGRVQSCDCRALLRLPFWRSARRSHHSLSMGRRQRLVGPGLARRTTTSTRAATASTGPCRRTGRPLEHPLDAGMEPLVSVRAAAARVVITVVSRSGCDLGHTYTRKRRPWLATHCGIYCSHSRSALGKDNRLRMMMQAVNSISRQLGCFTVTIRRTSGLRPLPQGRTARQSRS